MLIYQGTSDEFIQLNRMNRIADVMEETYFYFTGHHAGTSEYNSWQNSLTRVRDLLEIAELKDNYIALEYSVPYNNQSRIDCLLFGSSHNKQHVFLIELKQWSRVQATEIEGNYVETFTAGNNRIVVHPSQQVKGYHNYLLDFIEEFEKEPTMSLVSCAYCHNYSRTDDSGLFDKIYHKIIDEFPVYCKEDLPMLAQELNEKLSGGSGLEIFNRFMRSRIRPSKKLLDHVKDVILKGEQYSLINEQLIAKNLIWGKIRHGIKKNEKSVVIVKGGPGTGKSIIALNVLAEVAARKLTALFVCKSKPFREGLRRLVGGNAQNLFINPYFLVPAKVEENGLDVVFVDEAHRLEKANVHRYMKPELRSEMPQVDQIIRSARTSIFFIDDRQSVRNLEIGNSELIREAAARMEARVEEVELVTQFRCMGSNNYLEWIESVLGFNKKELIFRKNEDFDFQIFDTPHALYNALNEKEIEKPGSARLVAGFCWPWSKATREGTLVKDVKIGTFEMPWETKGDTWVGEYPPWYQWAIHKKGFEQVGCIYTAQGFEFDYIGVIVAPDLIYDPHSDALSTEFSATRDPVLRRDAGNYDDYIKNIYRVLLTRGMKGCYVYFVDKETEEFFKRRME